MFESQPEFGLVRAKPAVVMTQSLREMDLEGRSITSESGNELECSPLYRRQREALLKQKRFLENAPRTSIIEMGDFKMFEKSKSEPPAPSGGDEKKERGFREANLLLKSCDGNYPNSEMETLNGNLVRELSMDSEEYDNSDPLMVIDENSGKRSSVVQMHFV